MPVAKAGLGRGRSMPECGDGGAVEYVTN